jgi:hypothetical protein
VDAWDPVFALTRDGQAAESTSSVESQWWLELLVGVAFGARRKGARVGDGRGGGQRECRCLLYDLRQWEMAGRVSGRRLGGASIGGRGRLRKGKRQVECR